MGAQSIDGRRTGFRWGLALQAALFVFSGGLARADGDQTPSGMVAFFMTSGTACPPTWEAYPNAQGRLLLGVTDGSREGLVAPTPALADQTEPRHVHPYQTTLTMPGKKIEARESGNYQGGKSGTYPVPENPPGYTNGGTADSSQVPFVQLVVCKKQ